MWPVCFRFQGGKGVATGFGAALAIDWRVGLLALLFAALGVLVTKRMSCGSVAAAVSFPILVYIFISRADGSMGWEYIWAATMGLLIIWRHRTNILRIIHGEEPALTFFSGRKS